MRSTSEESIVGGGGEGIRKTGVMRVCIRDKGKRDMKGYGDGSRGEV